MELEDGLCGLGPSDLEKRNASWVAMGDRVRASERTENGFRISYDTSAAQELQALVEAERECCSWATWRLLVDTESAVVEVTGPSGPIAALAAAFRL